MKPGTLERLREFSGRYSIPSLNIGVVVHVDESVPVDEPVLSVKPLQIRVHPEDFAALRKWTDEQTSGIRPTSTQLNHETDLGLTKEEEN